MVTHNAVGSRDESGNQNIDSSLVTKWEVGMGFLIHHLDDLPALQRSNFAKIAGVRRLAEKRYPGRSLPEGRALRDIILECVTMISADLGSEPKLSNACRYLELAIKGVLCQDISRDLKLSREHVCRTYRRQALDLLARQFVLVVRSKPSEK